MNSYFTKKKVRASGRGLQRNGVRVGDIADFRVWTDEAGTGKLEVKIIGPGGRAEKVDVRQLADGTTFECKYFPKQPGRYSVIVQFGGKEIAKSPFEVNVGKKVRGVFIFCYLRYNVNNLHPVL